MAPVETAGEKRLLLLLTAIGFAILFAVSWQKWADLAIDGGREMNTPVRLLHGEMLYTDVYIPVRSARSLLQRRALPRVRHSPEHAVCRGDAGVDHGSRPSVPARGESERIAGRDSDHVGGAGLLRVQEERQLHLSLHLFGCVRNPARPRSSRRPGPLHPPAASGRTDPCRCPRRAGAHLQTGVRVCRNCQPGCAGTFRTQRRTRPCTRPRAPACDRDSAARLCRPAIENAVANARQGHLPLAHIHSRRTDLLQSDEAWPERSREDDTRAGECCRHGRHRRVGRSRGQRAPGCRFGPGSAQGAPVAAPPRTRGRGSGKRRRARRQRGGVPHALGCQPVQGLAAALRRRSLVRGSRTGCDSEATPCRTGHCSCSASTAWPCWRA